MESTILNVLKNVKGCKFANVVYMSDVKMKKTNNPLASAQVVKVCKVDVQFGYNYQNAVNNRLEKAGEIADFVAEKLPWGQWIVPNRFIENKGTIYVRFYRVKNHKTDNLGYLVDGQIATAEQIKIIEEFKQVSYSASKAQSAAGLDENQVEPFNVKLGNILRLTINGEFLSGEQAEQVFEVVKVSARA